MTLAELRELLPEELGKEASDVDLESFLDVNQKDAQVAAAYYYCCILRMMRAAFDMALDKIEMPESGTIQ